MPTSNEEIRDGLIRRQIRILRFSARMRRDVVRVFNRAEPELRSILFQNLDKIVRGFRGLDTGATRRRIANLRKLVADHQREAYKAVGAFLKGSLNDFAVEEARGISKFITATLPVVFEPAVPALADVRRTVTNQLIDGTRLQASLHISRTRGNDRLTGQVGAGLVQGETRPDIMRRVFGLADLNGTDGIRQVTRNGLGALVDTAVNTTGNNARRLVYVNNRLFISKEVFVATLDSRTTITCISNDGRISAVGEGPVPPLHTRCRSTISPVLDGRLLGTRPAIPATKRQLEGINKAEKRKRVRELIGSVPAKTTFIEFLRRAPVSFQNEALGTARSTAWRNGEIKISQFLDQSGELLTLKELRTMGFSL